jgi:aldehyde dehydrogenase
MNDVEIRDLVETIVRRVVHEATSVEPANSTPSGGNWGVFSEMNDAVEAAHTAFLEFKERSVQCRKRITDAVREVAIENKEELARMAVEETGMGRVDHKIAKIINSAKNSPGVEFLQPKAWSGKNGLALDEYAPFGVIGNISPSTHPVATMVNNIII